MINIMDRNDFIVKFAEQFEETEPVYVWADEFKIEQVVRNYVSNAYNHVNEEKIIEVKILREDGLAALIEELWFDGPKAEPSDRSFGSAWETMER